MNLIWIIPGIASADDEVVITIADFTEFVMRVGRRVEKSAEARVRLCL